MKKSSLIVMLLIGANCYAKDVINASSNRLANSDMNATIGSYNIANSSKYTLHLLADSVNDTQHNISIFAPTYIEPHSISTKFSFYQSEIAATLGEIIGLSSDPSSSYEENYYCLTYEALDDKGSHVDELEICHYESALEGKFTYKVHSDKISLARDSFKNYDEQYWKQKVDMLQIFDNNIPKLS